MSDIIWEECQWYIDTEAFNNSCSLVCYYGDCAFRSQGSSWHYTIRAPARDHLITFEVAKTLINLYHLPSLDKLRLKALL